MDAAENTVSDRVSRRQAGRWARQDQEPVGRQRTYGYAGPAPAAPPGGMDETLAQLNQLGQLRTLGVLSDAEFEKQKARVLGS